MKKENKTEELDDEGNISRNSKSLKSFSLYCLDHPEQRFFQALRNWAGVPYVLTSSHFEAGMFDEKFIKKNKKSFDIADTFYDA